MSKEKRRVPKLRFPGFTEDWEQRKFSDLYEKISEKNDLSYSLDKIISVANMYYKSDAKVSNEEYLRTYNIFRYGEIAFEGNKSKNFAYGRFVENTIGDGIISHVFEVFRPIVKYDIYFWKYYINYEPIMGKVLSRCTKKTTMMTNLVAKDFLKETILVPTLAEQKQIGTLLNTLDKFITLHQRKLDNLKLKKKALLQKLFPKNGERYPELRFPGFTDTWEQRKLGDYLIQYTEITTQNNQYPVLTSSRKGLFFQTDYYDGNQIASKDNTGYNIVPYGYFTYRHMSDDEIFHFNINYIVDKGIVSTLYPVFTTKNLNSNYLQLQLNYGSEFRKYAVLLKQGGSRTYMYFNKLKDLKLTISTSIDEQEIIAKFFISFEKLITLHQRKLDHLKLQKKALLQQMFV